jgi:hypothetical protein
MSWVDQAFRRIYIGMAVIGAAGTVVFLVWKGWRSGLGFAVGAALSALNFHWLKGAVDVLVSKFAPAAAPNPQLPSPKRAAARFVLRYGLLGLAAYAIFATSLVSVNGFLAGLFVFVAAVMVEMIVQLSRG